VEHERAVTELHDRVLRDAAHLPDAPAAELRRVAREHELVVEDLELAQAMVRDPAAQVLGHDLDFGELWHARRVTTAYAPRA
jgi:hypothetical protein